MSDRLISADALLKDITHRYCENCDRRKGMKNGVMKTIYEIGEAPCRACGIGDMRDELDDAPTVDAELVVRCKDCVYYNAREGFCEYLSNNYAPAVDMEENDFCSKGKRREDAR